MLQPDEIDRYSIVETEPINHCSQAAQWAADPDASGTPLPPYGDLHVLIAKRAYERYVVGATEIGVALADWLEAEWEILNHDSSA